MMRERLPDTSASRHSGTLRKFGTDLKTLIFEFDTKNVVRDTSTRVPWSRKSRDTWTQDNSDEIQLHRWFVLNFGTNFVMPKCLGAEVSCGRSVRPKRIHTCILFGPAPAWTERRWSGSKLQKTLQRSKRTSIGHNNLISIRCRWIVTDDRQCVSFFYYFTPIKR